MRQKMSYRWHLRQIMATRGMFATTDLIGPLAERGVELSREQVYRLVVGTPERLNLHVLAALCDILDCGPQELFEPVVETTQIRKTGTGPGDEPEPDAGSKPGRPPRARVVPPPTS